MQAFVTVMWTKNSPSFRALDPPRTAVKTSELALPKNILFFQNADSRISHEHNNLFHLNFFTSWVANIGIIQNFRKAANFLIILEFRMISRMTNH